MASACGMEGSQDLFVPLASSMDLFPRDLVDPFPRSVGGDVFHVGSCAIDLFPRDLSSKSMRVSTVHGGMESDHTQPVNAG
jgi:hypothetical protein